MVTDPSSPDALSFAGLERSHLRGVVYRRVFGDPASPHRIGRYTVLERVGAGARGVVFKAYDNQLDRLTALKVLSAPTNDPVELRREARALARLSHPNVLGVYEVGETEEGEVFLATEYVKGWTLRAWYEATNPARGSVLAVVEQIAAGVQAAHDEGLVHRDLKPGNILVGHEGRVRVADFGLARFDPGATRVTAAGSERPRATATAGTPGYMAPELLRGAAASAASDQYAFAVTVYELLCGGRPVPGQASRRGRVEQVLWRALSERPEARFPSVRAFASALRDGERPWWRRPVVALATGGVLAGVVGLGVLSARDDTRAVLEAQAELPGDPVAALEVLRGVEVPDEAAGPVVDRALALGPAQARFRAPSGTSSVQLWGTLAVFRDDRRMLHVSRISEHAAVRDGVAAMYVLNDAWVPGGLQFSSEPFAPRVEVDAPFLRDDPWAARCYGIDHPDLDVSRDGTRVAYHDPESGRLRVFDGAQRVEVWHSDVQVSKPRSVSLGPGGTRVAWAESDGTSFVAELASGSVVSLGLTARTVDLHPDGLRAVLTGLAGGAFVVRLDTGELTPLASNTELFEDARLSPDGSRVALQASDDTVVVSVLDAWSTQTLEGSTFRFSPDSRRLAIPDGKTVRIHDLDTGHLVRLTGTAEVTDVEFEDDSTVLTVGTDAVVRRHVLTSERVLLGHTQRVLALALSADGTTAVSTGSDYTVRVWDVEREEGRVLASTDWTSDRVVLDAAAGWVAVRARGRATPVLALDDGRVLEELPSSGTGLALAKPGVLVGGGGGSIWRYVDGELETVAEGLGACASLTASEGLVAAICHDDGSSRLHVWQDGRHQTAAAPLNLLLGESLLVWPNAEHLLQLGHDTVLYERGEDGEFRMQSFDMLPEGSHSLFPPKGSVSASGDLVLASQSGVYTGWGLEHDPVLVSGPIHGNVVAVSGDGRRVALGGRGHSIVVHERPLSRGHTDVQAALRAHPFEEHPL